MNNFKAARLYEKNLKTEKRKMYGIYYTPRVIVDYIVDNTVGKLNVLENPCPKILDSSCGCGNFLISAFEKLKELFEENSDELCRKYDDRFKKENICKYIIENCIYGTDIDDDAVKIAREFLLKKAGFNDYFEEEFKNNGLKINLYNKDGLKIDWKTKFDVIIGNPPYVGHKLLTKEYKKFVLNEYKEVYRDKSDLYFCFYKNSLDLIKDNGVIHLITPRYFLESMSASLLRSYIEKNAEIEEIIDFRGDEVFNYIGVSACIVRLRKSGYGVEKTRIYRKLSDDYVYINDRRKIDPNIEHLKKDDNMFESIVMSTKILQSNWVIANEKNMEIYLKIEEKDGYRLEEIADSFQGIITGCDKAFILKNGDARIENINPKLLKNWVKNKSIDKYMISNVGYKLIYSNDIESDKDEEYVFEHCISPYRKKLENRRECLNNVRKWYELQWGREKRLFERKKVMYPYKSRDNRFAVDYDHLYSSADVYSFYLKKEFEEVFSYEYIVALLNSSIYNKYYKINAKKMSRGIYDYYPNKVMKMKIFKGKNFEKIEHYSKKVMEKKRNILDNRYKIEFDNFDTKEGIKNIEEINQKLSSDIEILIQKIDSLVEEDIFR